MKCLNYTKLHPGFLAILVMFPSMANHYLLWATGEDHPGFVAQVTKLLFDLKCNLEDSSMMRLGSEFAMFAIFTSEKSLASHHIDPIRRSRTINVGLKKISQRQARFLPNKRDSFIIRVHGQDKAGIVYRLTQALAKHKFNITDLSTHRTEGKKAGYVLWLEGELLKKTCLPALMRDLRLLEKNLKIHISAEPVSTVSL